MVCIYCSVRTSVSNSRAQKRTNQVWRRRVCQACQSVFTTVEGVDFERSIVVKRGSLVESFSRDILFLSIFKACGHRKDACRDATALTATVISKLLKYIKSATLSQETITTTVTEVLKHFDKVAAVQYEAYHPL